MHDDQRLIGPRLERAVRRVILPALERRSVPLTVAAWPVVGDPVPFAVAAAADHTPVQVGDPWGAPWTTTWFRVEGRVPDDWAGETVEAVIDLFNPADHPGFQAEGLVRDRDGAVVKGLHPRNSHVPVARTVHGGEEVVLHVEAAANPSVLTATDRFAPTPLGDPATAGTGPLYRINRADLVVRDTTVWHLHLDIQVLAELAATLGDADPRRYEILLALDEMLDLLDPTDPAGTAAAARARLEPVLSRPAVGSALTMSAVANAHIDSAWLWPLRETVRKCVRTFANVTALAEDYPELVFALPQAQQLAWVAEAEPDLHRRIGAAVRTGTIVPVGGMWVEPDGNLPGGEAMARQLVIGKRYFLEAFGVDCGEGWMPDSFGYSAALPQLARLAGIDRFLTQKLSWNDTDTFPHHSFWWEGLDGSRVFAHFPPVDTYTAELTGAELARAIRNFADKGRSTRALLPFGHGDGGGGPTREMLERARRWRSLEGAPRVEIETPAAFFAAASADYADAAVWSGELYLELHRGTFTNQAALKRGNRRSEHLLREAELWAATAAVTVGSPYPYDDLERIWRTVLLHQFHDILPGSSIAWVNAEALAIYAAVEAELEALIATALAALAGGGTGAAAGRGGWDAGGGGWLANAGPHARHGYTVEGGAPVRIPALGLAPAVPAPGAEPPRAVTVEGRVVADGLVIDNGLVRVELDGRGLVISLVDLVVGRELVAPGAALGLLQLHRDEPAKWDGWDLDRSYRRLGVDLDEAVPVVITASGPGTASVEVERIAAGSTIRQRISVLAGSAEVRFDTEVDWRTEERILKLAFPFDVHSDEVAAEIQFGHLRRPTHTNTSWDAARYEQCCHRWVHLGEAGYGVALANDATYGYDVARSARPGGGITTTLRASLVRGARFPDPGADAGTHRFSHVVVPGATIADAVAAGYRLNLPVRAVTGPGRTPPAPLVAVAATGGEDSCGAVIESVKLADDRSGDVVVRLYEALGGRAAVTVSAGFPLAAAVAVDLLEREVGDGPAGIVVMVTGDVVTLELRPFQILTLRLTPAVGGSGPDGPSTGPAGGRQGSAAPG